jgi:hypothetical protein
MSGPSIRSVCLVAALVALVTGCGRGGGNNGPPDTGIPQPDAGVIPGAADRFLLTGTILTPDQVVDGQMLVESDKITCVAAWTGPGCGSNDSYEPNNSMVMANYMKRCANRGLEGITGSEDVDVYDTGDCDFGAIVATGPLMPWAQIDEADADAVRVCVFPTCAKGATNVFACVETAADVQATDDMASVPADLWNNNVGFRGCCRVGPGRITAEVDCPRRSTTIDTYVWIEPKDHDDPKCHPYKWTYSASK